MKFPEKLPVRRNFWDNYFIENFHTILSKSNRKNFRKNERKSFLENFRTKSWRSFWEYSWMSFCKNFERVDWRFSEGTVRSISAGNIGWISDDTYGIIPGVCMEKPSVRISRAISGDLLEDLPQKFLREHLVVNFWSNSWKSTLKIFIKKTFGRTPEITFEEIYFLEIFPDEFSEEFSTKHPKQFLEELPSFWNRSQRNIYKNFENNF